MLKKINSLLPYIHIPSWIKRAILVLGKASFGKLKADEWRNLFTIQLPLILIPIWYGNDHVQSSLLKNFCHLVSPVNLALKRVMTSDIISKYRQHIQNYLESSVILFDTCQPTCNHHMEIHLADCFEKLGPVRAWWSFPLERLMGDILKGCHNNHLGKHLFKSFSILIQLLTNFTEPNPGEMEITFLKTFCCAGNLSALLQDLKLPEALRPYMSRLKEIFEQPVKNQKPLSNSNMEPLSPDILRLLIKRLNTQALEDCVWVTPARWSAFSKESAFGCAPVTAQANFYNNVTHLEVSFSTFRATQKDSFIMFKSDSTGVSSFGRIHSIFVHRRSPEANKNIVDTWLNVQAFCKLQPGQYNPFSRINEPNMQVELRQWDDPESVLVRLDEVVAHCAWMIYKPGDIHKSVKVSTVAMVSMDRW